MLGIRACFNAIFDDEIQAIASSVLIATCDDLVVLLAHPLVVEGNRLTASTGDAVEFALDGAADG